MQRAPETILSRPVQIGNLTRRLRICEEAEGEMVVCVTDDFKDGHQERKFICGLAAVHTLNEHRALLSVQ